MTRARVLFVDDEPRILDGLRRSLRSRRGEWEMSFATSGAEALSLLAESPQDIVVSDMRMPEMNGAELLTAISERYPDVARVVLSGHTEPQAAIKVAVAAHRFLTKPSEPESVIEVIEQLAVRTSRTHPAEARWVAGAVRCLPSLPAHAVRLDTLVRAPDAELPTVIRTLSRDIGLTAKLLQLSNSSFFGAQARVVSVESVVNTLGLPTIQALVGECRKPWSTVPWSAMVDREVDLLWRHAVASALLVGSIASPANRPYAQAAALLQDIGRLICLMGDEPAVRQVPHRDIAVELLHLWGLPPQVIAAVAERDVSRPPAESGLGVTGAVRTAHLLVRQAAGDRSGPALEELEVLLAHPQLVAQATDWRKAAEEAVEAAERWSTEFTPPAAS